MPNYASTAQDTAANTLFALRIDAPAASARRGSIYDFVIGCEATPADQAFLWEVKRCTGAPTGSAITPEPLQSADAAALSEVLENVTVNGSEGSICMKIPMNQRATFRWVAAPGSELVFPATDNNGFGFEPTTGPASVVSITLFHSE